MACVLFRDVEASWRVALSQAAGALSLEVHRYRTADEVCDRRRGWLKESEIMKMAVSMDANCVECAIGINWIADLRPAVAVGGCRPKCDIVASKETACLPARHDPY